MKNMKNEELIPCDDEVKKLAEFLGMKKVPARVPEISEFEMLGD